MTSRTVLLIEDEEALCQIIARFLEKGGYHAVLPTANDPYGPPDCRIAVIDLTLPGVSGIERAERFLARAPDAKVVLISGLPAGQDFAARWAPNVAFLQKPFSPQALLETLSRLL